MITLNQYSDHFISPIDDILIPDSFNYYISEDKIVKPSRMIGNQVHRQAKYFERNFLIRPFSTKEFYSVFQLLNILPVLYPEGGVWLNNRLDDVINRKASCYLIIYNKIPVGITIETPKFENCLKLSTIYIHPQYRKIGLGSYLLSSRCQHWIKSNIREVYVTIAENVEPSLKPLLSKFNFIMIAFEKNRYGENRNEFVYKWTLR